MTARTLNRSSLFIGGEWVRPLSGRIDPVINPATEAPIGTAPVGNAEDADRAIAAARDAFDNGPWPRLSYKARAERLQTLYERIVAGQDDLAAAIVAECGATCGSVSNMHIGGTLNHMRFAIEATARREAITPLPPVTSLPGGARAFNTAVKVREPLGVVSAITPYNCPFLVSIAKSVAALAMGCTVVLKPAPFTPLQVLMIGDFFDGLDFPPGVLNIITGGIDVGAKMTTDKRVDMVSFTGSDKVGAEIVKQGADTLKRVVLELGGKSALIVRHDANLDRAAAAAAGVFTTMAGQGCSLKTRLLVHHSVRAEFTEKLQAIIGRIKIGDPNDPTVAMGPVISAGQRNRTERFVDEARDLGARILAGGLRPAEFSRGYYYAPTLMDRIEPDWRIAQQEIFGPVAVILGFDSDAEAVRIANDSEFGLSGGIFSADVAAAYEMALQMRTGGIGINGASLFHNPYALFGGYKRSGLGREYGEEGLDEFTATKAIAINVLG